MTPEDHSESSTYTTRPATPADARAIAQVHVISWQKIYRGVMSDVFLDTLEPSQREAMWSRTLQRGDQHVDVACDGSAVVAFCSSGTSRDAPTDAEIYAIYAHPDYWGKGLGKQLFVRTCEAMKRNGFERITLWVATQNAQGRAFYERAGMTFDGGLKSASIGGTEVEEMRYTLGL